MILKNLNEGNMNVRVPNKTFKRKKTHQFDSFVQYIRTFSDINIGLNI